MDPDSELHQAQSPRIQVELEAELGNIKEENHFQFGEEDNPFSYYHEDNHRDPTSSDEDNHPPPTSATSPPPLPASPHHFQNIQIPENLSSKPPIALVGSPKNKPKKTEIQPNSPPPSLNMYKDAQFNLGSIGNKEPVNSRPIPATERAYKSELEGDLNELKKKYLLRDKKESKKEVNLNKTFANLPRKQTRQSTVEFEEMRMLVKMGFEKKKANYEMLREWDRRRAEILALHGKIIEVLQSQVDLRIKSSLQNFEYYQTFFREKAKQQQKYASSPVINTRYALQNNSLSRNVYINCSVILNSLCDENTARCKKINDFVTLIRNNILQELTEAHLSNSQRQLLKVRQKISTLKSALKKHNVQTQQRANQLAALFSQQSNNITNHTEKDFYRTQLSFLRKALKQIEVQRKLGQYCLEYYHTAIAEELKRSKVIRQAMITYSKGLKATYSFEAELQEAEIEQMSKQEQVKLIEEFFSLDDMFDSRIVQLFRLNTQTELTIDSFTSFIKKFDYDSFDSRILLLKEFQVQHITGKGKQKKEEPCFLAITVDNFLHLFHNTSKPGLNKPDITIKIAHKWLELRPGRDQYLEMIKKQERRGSMMSYFWDSKVEKSYRVRFPKKDNKEQFTDYISKLMVDQF